MYWRVFVFAVILNSAGCVLVPFVDSYQKSGMSRSSRQQLLARDVKQFHEALYWGKANLVLAFIDEEVRSDLGDELFKNSRKERIVSSEVDSYGLSPEGFDANVRIRVKYFRVPFYIVQERLEEQRWEFELGSGWQIHDREVKGTELAGGGRFG